MNEYTTYTGGDITRWGNDVVITPGDISIDGGKFVVDGGSIEWDSSPTPRQSTVPQLAPSPFRIYFERNGKQVAITLKDGEDIFIVADAYERFLIGLGVEYEVERTDASAKVT